MFLEVDQNLSLKHGYLPFNDHGSFESPAMLQMQKSMLMYASSTQSKSSRNHVVMSNTGFVDPHPLNNAIVSIESQSFGANRGCYITNKNHHEDENSVAKLYMFANDLPGKIDNSL